jgi:endonuclease/exonuclease/phosphatase family metal-dependent hydrolase
MFANRLGRLTLSVLPLALLAALAIGCVRIDAPVASDESAKGYLFCFWNVENYFDDEVNDHRNEADKKFDAWFAENPPVLKHKLANLSKALIAMNDGKGPDIIALAEVESHRAAEMLMDALNSRLKDPELHYQHVLMKEPKNFGRSIATVIITRLPVVGDKTRLHGNRQRILEGHVTVNGHDLVILATHWTSRVSDDEGIGRDKYAKQIYGTYKAMYLSNPKVCFLVCGDFNDAPDDESVTKFLHGSGDLEKVKKSGGDDPLLYNLFADMNDRKHGTHFYNGKWEIFDQILISPAMLTESAWHCQPETAKIVSDLTADRRGHPKRFGSPHDKIDLEERGYSDHFPVTVRLDVAGK